MKKYYPLITVSFYAFALMLAPAVAADSPPPGAVAAAENGLLPFLKLIPPDEMDDFGFAGGDQLKQATLGTPFQLYTITPQALLGARPDTPVGSLVTSTGIWYFPVMLDGKARTILTVEMMGETWQAVNLGKAELAGELEKVRQQWSEKKGYNPRLVAIYQAATYFFTVPEKDSYNFTPLTFDGVGFAGYYQKTGPEYSSTTSFSNMIGPLKNAVRENIGKQPE